ncbi:YfgM family protein [Vibrio ostreicida]|uniref:Ancillary SecYEG translocon subunit n=1 Tax=Vibrio ostreicida TaxID=526588 RepID=A0ABT8BUH8_9VIBR|nr:YfgM family protein [Vibrio ostreicida]MDN3610800.1 YfgM family protein [Vibrio ostreicida]NPD07210.1 YfgM family protein [Vibrio ostreicida]
MELYDTEEQQVDAIKDWFRENGKVVIVGAVLGLGGLFGWRYYQDAQIAAQEMASDSYTNVVQILAEQGAQGESAVQEFIESNQETQYAVLAALQLAKVQVEAGDLDAALAQLDWAQSATTDQALVSVIAFRMARVNAEQGEFDTAISNLSSISDESWAGRVAELKGDILLRKGDTEGAYAAYTEAQQADDASQTLQMKLDDLAK